MGMRTVNDPYGDPSVLVDTVFGTSYDAVRHVANNIDFVKKVANLFDTSEAIVANIHQRYVSTEGQNEFELPVTVVSEAFVTVFVNGKWRSPSVTYTAYGTTLLFNQALDEGDVVDAMIVSGETLYVLEQLKEEAEQYENRAREWAEAPEDTEVEPGQYSARHHSAKASAQRVLAEQAVVNATDAASAADTSAGAAADAANAAEAAADAAAKSLVDNLAALLANNAPSYPVGTIFATRAEGMAFEVPSVPEPSDLTTAGGVRLRLLASESVAPVGGGIVPMFHFRQASTRANPKIVIMGDSLSTPAPTFTADQTDSLWGQIKRAFTEANPHLTPQFVNMAWGTRTWTNANQTVASQISAGAPVPGFAYGDGSGTWLSYVQAEAPDILILAFGMNDRQDFVTAQARAVIDATRTWPTVPDLMIVTPMVPNRLSANTNISSEAAQQGRYFNAHWSRSWALYNRVALLDLNRQYARVVHGIDPRNTFLTLDGAAALQTLPYTFPNEVDQDFGLEITGPSTLISTGMAVRTSMTGSNEYSELRFGASGGNVLLRIVSQHNVNGTPSNAIDIVSSVPVPLGPFTMTVFVKDCWARVMIGTSTIYDGPIIRHGGRFTPVVTYFSGASTVNIRTWTGRYYRNTPALSDDLMWGWASASNEAVGGNDLNHPTSRGAAYVYRQLIDAEDWTIPSLTMGATPYVNTMGRQIGIATTRPRAALHITKTGLSTNPLPSPLANNLVLEDINSAGMSALTGPSGSGRYLMGTTAQPSAAGMIYAASSGNLTLWAVNANAFTLVDPGSDQLTAAQLLVNLGGTKSLKPVYVGAADSGGTGFRTLRIPN